MQPVALQRVFINVGHGLNSSSYGHYDTGAISCFGGPDEHSLVQQIADDLLDVPNLPVAIEVTPPCSPQCVHRLVFKKSEGRKVPISHLEWTIEWVNDNWKAGDYLLSLHMDAPDENAEHPELPTGVSVYYSSGASSARHAEALAVGKAVAAKLGTPFRGAFPDSASHRKHLGILDDTELPALLIEAGFVTNQADVSAVKECGGEAIADGITALYGLRGGK